MKYPPKIGTQLVQLGMNASLLGFGYIEYAVRIVFDNPLLYYNGKRAVFKLLCDEFEVSRDKASRCMQYAINAAWNNPSSSLLRSLFPTHSKEYPPLIMEYICCIALHLYRIEHGDYFTNLVRGESLPMKISCDEPFRSSKHGGAASRCTES